MMASTATSGLHVRPIQRSLAEVRTLKEAGRNQITS